MLNKILPKKISFWWRERYFRKLKNKKPEEIFSDIYKDNVWGGEKGTFYSGTGTANPNTEIYISNLIALIKENNIQSLLDIGCGDFTIMQQVLDQVNVQYTGGDVVAELIKYNQSNFQNNTTRFIKLNAIDDELPDADLLIIRQVLQHLNNNQIQIILDKLPKFKYVLVTEHIPVTPDAEYNIDKIAGPHIRMRVNSGVFIDKPPFNVQNTSVLWEYRQDDEVKGKMLPAAIRTYLIKN